jgi:hypothetical protein
MKSITAVLCLAVNVLGPTGCATETDEPPSSEPDEPDVEVEAIPRTQLCYGIVLDSAASCGANGGQYCDWAPYNYPGAYACWNKNYMETSDCPRCCGQRITDATSCFVGQYYPISGYNNGGLPTRW